MERDGADSRKNVATPPHSTETVLAEEEKWRGVGRGGDESSKNSPMII